MVVETPGKVKIKAAQKVDIQSPETEITGNATVSGLLTYTAGLTASNAGGGAAANIKGTVNITGDLIVRRILPPLIQGAAKNETPLQKL